jgi:hypothetical protein
MTGDDPDRPNHHQHKHGRPGRAGLVGTARVASPPPTGLRLRTAADVLALLEEQVGAVRADPDAGPLEKARAAGYLAGIALKAIEAGNLEARLEALEAVLRQREGRSS